jgi:serine/threonine protein kinase
MSSRFNQQDETVRTDPHVEETTSDETEPRHQTWQEKIAPGMTFKGRYVIERELGKGGIGAVFLAHDLELLSKPVVIKVLLEKSQKDQWVVNKFKHEIEALTRIDHPGVVSVLDSGTLSDGTPFLVMQYIEGGNLREALTPDGMDLQRSANIIVQLGRALSAAHEKGVVHRDLKPENIMLQPLSGGGEQVKIIDFGIAKVKDSRVAPSTVTGEAAGTIAYMAPEQLNALPISGASDTYALGAIVYEMLTGRRPFNPETMFQLCEMQRAGVRVKPSDLRPAIPEAAQEAICKALAYNPNDRYISARQFGEDVARALGDISQMPTDRTFSEASTLSKPRFRRGRNGMFYPALIAGAVFLVLGLIAVVAFWNRKSSDEAGAVKTNTQSPAPSASSRNLNYWLTVQKMRERNPYQSPFESSGQEIFENGWKFRLNLESTQAGHLYILNEGPSGTGGVTYNLLYPTPTINHGSAQLAAEQKVLTGWYVMDENQGTEKLWVVWAEGEVAELEAVKGVVNPKDRGAITNPEQSRAVRDLISRHSANKARSEVDKASKQTRLTGVGTILIGLVELEHH